ncbi:MAG: 50S ribosomal protein L27 [Patescibacteria group bacterium]
MAHKKTGGAVKGNRDSVGRRLGVKKFGSEKVFAGNIIIRQRGAKFIAGNNVKIGADDTLYATKDGVVKFSTRRKPNFSGAKNWKKTVEVV